MREGEERGKGREGGDEEEEEGEELKYEGVRGGSRG